MSHNVLMATTLSRKHTRETVHNTQHNVVISIRMKNGVASAMAMRL